MYDCRIYQYIQGLEKFRKFPSIRNYRHLPLKIPEYQDAMDYQDIKGIVYIHYSNCDLDTIQ